jgi:formylglycine-generating enzyme required for sulfatase activity
MKAMLMSKLKLVLTVVLLLGCMVAGAAILACNTATGNPDAEKPEKGETVKGPPKDFTNGLGMKFVWIPPGNFMMGSPKVEKERHDGETQHKVTLTKGFYMGVHTVTQEQWQEVMGNNPSHYKGEKNLPVDNVSWDDCQEFIKKLGEKTKDKKAYRLPTEAEWEYACRAGTTTPFHFGETISTEQANYNGDFVYGNGKKGVLRNKTTPVGSFPANAWGLHDMHGNVFQWCQDWYGEYPNNEETDPRGPTKGLGFARGQERVLRGGSEGTHPWACRSAYRYASRPDNSNFDCGFRLCFSAE